jgi:tRNA-dihydrouridine synthase A
MALFSPLAIAPMIDWTNTYFRIMMRLLAPSALLYTEMQTTGAIAHNPERSLRFSAIENPLALQLGGSNPDQLRKAAQQAEQLGYDEINLNLGCPSDRVQSGRFGACLMLEPELVVKIIRTLKQFIQIPVTVKTRIGIDHQDEYDFFADFVDCLVDAGCDKLIVHARKAWLKGLSPKQNRTIPPINYDYVYRIKRAHPALPVVINGNITDLDSIHMHLSLVDGVMLGRLACNNPYAIAEIHHALYPDTLLLSRQTVVKSYCNHLQSLAISKVPLSIVLKPLFGMAHGVANARAWKQHLMTIHQIEQVDSRYFGEAQVDSSAFVD